MDELGYNGFDFGGFAQDVTEMTISGNDITIHIDPFTGEYVAWVYPELYEIGDIKSDAHGTIYNRHERLDLRNAPVAEDAAMKKNTLTWGDSVLVDGKRKYEEHIDTIRYHHEWNFEYRPEPIYTLRQWVTNGEDDIEGEFVDYFGEKEYVLGDTTLMLVNLDVQPLDSGYYTFGKPVFQQGRTYSFVLVANEYYISDTKLTIEALSLEDATFSITSTIAENTAPVTLQVDPELGVGFYQFVAGAPSGGVLPKLNTIMTVGGRSYYSDLFGAEGMEAYVLGGTTTGTDFRTSAPPKVDFVLHDPPGTSSYAYINAGTTLVHTEFDSWTKGTFLTTKVAGSLGYSTMMVLGPIGTSASVLATLGEGVESTWTSAGNGSMTTSYTFTQGFSTMGNPALFGAGADVLVGDAGDLFVGQAVNTVYGKVNAVEIRPTETFSNKDNILSDTVQAFAIGKTSIMGVGESFETSFAYTEYEIENIMIPKWREAVRGVLSRITIPLIKDRSKEWNDSAMYAKLQSDYGIDVKNITAPVYVSHLRENHSKFGLLNSDTAFHERATAEGAYDGPSYTIIWDTTSLAIMNMLYEPNLGHLENGPQDSVLMAYDQINGWLNILAQNELTKLMGEYPQNASFGAGVGNVGISAAHNELYSFGTSSNRTHRVYLSAHEEAKVSGDMSVSARRVASGGGALRDAASGSAPAAVAVVPAANRAALHPGSRRGGDKKPQSVTSFISSCSIGSSSQHTVRSHSAQSNIATSGSRRVLFSGFYAAGRSALSHRIRPPQLGHSNFFWGVSLAGGHPYMYQRTVSDDGTVVMKRLTTQPPYSSRDAFGNTVKKLGSGHYLFLDVRGGYITDTEKKPGDKDVLAHSTDDLPRREVSTDAVKIDKKAFIMWNEARPDAQDEDTYFGSMSAFIDWRGRHEGEPAVNFFKSGAYANWNRLQTKGKAVATAKKWTGRALRAKWNKHIDRKDKHFDERPPDLGVQSKGEGGNGKIKNPAVIRAIEIALDAKRDIIPIIFAEHPTVKPKTPPRDKIERLRPKPKPRKTPHPHPKPRPKPRTKTKTTPPPTPPPTPKKDETTKDETTKETTKDETTKDETTKDDTTKDDTTKDDTTKEDTKKDDTTREDTTTEEDPEPEPEPEPEPDPDPVTPPGPVTPDPVTPEPEPPLPYSPGPYTPRYPEEEEEEEEPSSDDETPEEEEEEEEEEDDDDDDDSSSSSLESVKSKHFIPPKDTRIRCWDRVRELDDGDEDYDRRHVSRRVGASTEVPSRVVLRAGDVCPPDADKKKKNDKYDIDGDGTPDIPGGATQEAKAKDVLNAFAGVSGGASAGTGTGNAFDGATGGKSKQYAREYGTADESGSGGPFGGVVTTATIYGTRSAQRSADGTAGTRPYRR
ncbi:hypothetical protein AGMMS49982_20120 [Bacteroidia bacterium]|nr:hypothetical protein AGMMS49982_20120 [Bacteroidia bacterium]